jgi:hypothetical protein
MHLRLTTPETVLGLNDDGFELTALGGLKQPLIAWALLHDLPAAFFVAVDVLGGDFAFETGSCVGAQGDLIVDGSRTLES